MGNGNRQVALDAASSVLLDQPSDHLLDAMFFSSPDARFSEVYVAGRRVVDAGRVESWQRLADGFACTMRTLWA